MPSVKRTGVKSAEVKTGFESYDGPEPSKRGQYRSRISILQYKVFRSGADGFKIMLVLEADKGDPKGHAQFDGYTIYSNLVFGDKEAMITREQNFYAALGLKDEPTIVYAEGDPEQGVDIKTLGGKSLAALQKLFVNADIKMGSYEGVPRPEVDGIYKVKEVTAAPAARAAEPEEDDSDLYEDEEAEDETEEGGEQDRAEELSEATLADLRGLAKEYGIKTVGLKKGDLVDAILDYEGGSAEPEDEDAEEPEPDEEPEEEDEADEPEDEEEEPDDEADERGDRAQELAELDRTELKRVIKTANADYTVYKSTTDDAIREAILDAEFGAEDETPF